MIEPINRWADYPVSTVLDMGFFDLISFYLQPSDAFGRRDENAEEDAENSTNWKILHFENFFSS